MGARAVAVGVLLLAVVACGGEPTTRAMDVKFEQIDYEMATLETLTSPYGPHLEKATQRYVALIREYADQLGSDEVKRRLKEKGEEVAPYCLPCTATLDDEAKRY